MREVANAAGAGAVGIMIACYVFGVISGIAISIIAASVLGLT
jgi:hypothetical protein